ncbi:hypothetical protein ADL15_07195 [Actinoplanes awajinensis subsp. mycoplanecinus]|uniref:Uncharacterized protein n=1 Tax=Actinoplanes awajinensis subsp. mycoplanecinus TaxID=135947 RepID=A0A0X3V6T2_9ACTN|nr:hypothetical protein ADL15_07195 [Actinoplanes awajinensis subsp. mycoplanecinus]
MLAIAAALTVFLAVGVFWLTRLAVGGTGEEAAFVAPPASAPPSSAAPSSAAPAGTPDPLPGDAVPPTTTTAAPTATGDDDGAAPGKPQQTTTEPTNQPTSKRPSSRPPSSSPPPPPAPKPRVIEVGGVTLNNRNPQTMCTLFRNADAGLPVTISNLRVSGKLTIDPGTCSTNGDIGNKPRCRSGMTLQPDASCYTGTVPTSDKPGEYAGYVRLDARGKCTSPSPKACSGPELRDDPPSVTRPVIVTWTVRSEEAVCYAIRAPDDENQEKFCTATPDGE